MHGRTVHQQDLSLNEKILRHFDLSSQYGVRSLPSPTLFPNPLPHYQNHSLTQPQPCIGIARMKRWKRAHNLGLQPPIEVLAVLLKEEDKSNVRAKRAHVDELMSSRFIIN